MITIHIADAARIAELDRALPGGMPDTHPRRFALQKQNKALYYIAYEGDEPVGYMLLHTTGPTHSLPVQYAPECTYIEGLTVRPDKRQQGIASQLLQQAETFSRANGHAEIGLAVGVTNAEARTLYKKNSYRKEAPEPFWVEWAYLNKETGETGTEGEWCEFWLKPLNGRI